MQKNVRILGTVLFLLAFSVGGASAALKTISQPVTNEFGTYSPITVSVTPSVADITVAGDFSNVNYYELLGRDLDAAALAILAERHFVAVPAAYKQPYDIYNWAAEEGVPSFVTTDAMLHTFHVLYDYCLRILETELFIGYLEDYNSALLDAVSRRVSTDSAIERELEKLTAYVSLGRILANPAASIPTRGEDLARSELALIGAHEGGRISPIFGVKVDYSQFVSRGHYTRSQELSDYFMGMMWYGRIGFRLRPGEAEEEIELGRSHTRMALNLVSVLAGLDVNGVPALEIWEKIYRPTAFFVGSADDLTPAEYAELAEDVYGVAAEELTAEQIADQTLLDTFISRALEYRSPRINSSLLGDGADAEVASSGLRMMSQRFIPDSYMFWKLVHPNVYGRAMPRGLDVMAVLGSQEAEELLDIMYGEMGDPNYAAALDSLQQEFAALPAADWAQNLYYNWLYCLAPLFGTKGTGYPSFMRDEAWRRKELATAMGSWAELRHDTILYAKQSYTLETSMPPALPTPYGYVEPEPEVFARLAALARYMRTSFESMDLLPDEIGWRLEEFDNLAVNLKTMAETLLGGGEISSADKELIDSFGKRIEPLIDFSPDGTTQAYESETDGQMAVVADVHTDPNTSSVLEVAVGNPLALYVIVSTPDGPSLTVGAMFSYYEFKQPMSDRLTDESWQEMLAGGSVPSPAEWMEDFLADLETRIEEYRNFQTLPDNSSSIRLSLPSGTIVPGDKLTVELEYPSGEGLSARFYSGESFLGEAAFAQAGGEDTFAASVSTSSWPSGSVRVEIYSDTSLVRSAYLQFAYDESPTDLDGNGKTNVMDLLEFLRLFKQNAAPDLNHDDQTNIFDLLEVLKAMSGSGSGPSVRLAGLGGCNNSTKDYYTTRLAASGELELRYLGDGTVSFTHSNAVYNCCLDRIDLSLTSSGNTLRVIEQEVVTNACRCVCSYEVQGEITDLEAGTYTVEVVSAADESTVLSSGSVTVE